MGKLENSGRESVIILTRRQEGKEPSEIGKKRVPIAHGRVFIFKSRGRNRRQNNDRIHTSNPTIQIINYKLCVENPNTHIPTQRHRITDLRHRYKHKLAHSQSNTTPPRYPSIIPHTHALFSDSSYSSGKLRWIFVRELPRAQQTVSVVRVQCAITWSSRM